MLRSNEYILLKNIKTWNLFLIYAMLHTCVNKTQLIRFSFYIKRKDFYIISSHENSHRVKKEAVMYVLYGLEEARLYV